MYGDIQIRISKIQEVKAEEKKAISEAGSESSRRTKLKLAKMELPKLLNLVVLNARRQNTIIDRLYDGISAYFQSLELLNIPSEYLEVFIFPLVESCLPTEILQVWQRTPEASCLKNEKDRQSRGSFVSTNYDRKSKCIFCDNKGHVNWKCFKVRIMTRDEQLKKTSDAGVCFKCLKSNHLRRHCRTKIICQNCRGPHYLIFCRGNNSRRDSLFTQKMEGVVKGEKIFSAKLKVLRSVHTVLFIPNTFNDSESKNLRIRIREIERTEIDEKRFWRSTNKRGNAQPLFLFHREFVKEETVQVKAMGQRMICDRVPILTAETWVRDQDNKEIDLLLGTDNLSKIWTDQVVYLKDRLTAINAKIGWSIFGEIYLREVLASEYMSPVFLTMSHKIKDLWNLEMLGVRDLVENISQRETDRGIKSNFIETIIKRDEGHYSVSFPWKEGYYSKIFTEWEQDIIIERIHEDNKAVGHYLPHIPVFK
ncbi:hypothetical protein LAZ67_21001994 [Cordylochernes scorpioides]|uniref:CCHC-type domain-containing protein n=1 Tax=Cordylochernes scorpioides TaxID=51811 RepID=A0ABY6LMN3_9ARAC|nr:hypothetical protein LAZ67_21001994 [Cordylochernes scorpioides]